MNKCVISLPPFVSPDSVKEIFADAIMSHKYYTHIVIDFSKLNILDQQSFKAILDAIKIFKLSGSQLAICEIAPHIAIEIATLVPRNLRVLQNANDEF